MKIRIANKILKQSNIDNNEFYAAYVPWLNEYMEEEKNNPYSLKMVALKYLKPKRIWKYSEFQRNNAIHYKNKCVRNYYKKINY